MANGANLEEEFREFVAARSGALLRTAYLLTGDWASAEDLLQTALTKTYLAWKRLGAIESVEPYVRRVLVNTATSWWRRRWHGERPTEVLPEQPGPDRHQEALERDVLWQHVRALPARQRAVLVLRFYEDLSEAQTAELLDISPGTVKSQTSRALATLRRQLGAAGLAPPTPGGLPEPAVDTQPRPVPPQPRPAFLPDPGVQVRAELEPAVQVPAEPEPAVEVPAEPEPAVEPATPPRVPVPVARIGGEEPA